MEVMINDLKSICNLLGIDSSDNDFTDCDLAHDLLHRIIIFLGGE